MRGMLSGVVVMVASVGCTRHAPAPPPPPRVTPTALEVRPTHSMPPAPPPRNEGESTVVWPQGRSVPALVGRIDALSVAVRGSEARVAVNVGGSAPYATVVSIDGEGVHPPVRVPNAKLGAMVVDQGVLRPMTFVPHGDSILAGTRIGSMMNSVFDELVASSTDRGFAAAGVGMAFDCMPEDDHLCTFTNEGSRMMQTETIDGRKGWQVSVVQPGPDGLLVTPVGGVECGANPGPWIEGDDTRCGPFRSRAPDDVAVAYGPVDTAVAWRGAHALHLVVVGPTGAVAVPEVVFARGDVGAPTLAWHGDRLSAVWAARANAHAPYALSYAEWVPGAVPPSVAVMSTGTASAFAPAVHWVGDRVVLAWTEGNDRTGVVRLGTSWQGLGHATDHIVTVSAPDRNARDPELGWDADGSHGWLAWSERPAGHAATSADAEVHVSPVVLP